MKNLTRTLIAAVATAAVLAPAAGAHAETWSHRDAVKDVQQAPVDSDDDLSPAPGNRTADIRRVTVSHQRSRLVVTTKLRKLVRSNHGAFTDIRTPAGRFEFVTMHMFGVKIQMLTRANGTDVTCRGLRATSRPRTATMRVSIPRSCLGDPAWVRVGQGAYAMNGTMEDSGTIFADDALRNRLDDEDVKLSKRIRRG